MLGPVGLAHAHTHMHAARLHCCSRNTVFSVCPTCPILFHRGRGDSSTLFIESQG